MNESSRGNLESIQRFIANSSSLDPQKMEKPLSELAGFWANGAIFDVRGPGGIRLHHAPLFAQAQAPLPSPPAQGVAFLTTNLNSSQYRVAAERIHGQARSK